MRSSILQADDMNVGDWITIHSLNGSDYHHPDCGVAFQISGINLPFLMIKPAYNINRNCVMDTRLFNLMRLNDEFVQLQLQNYANQMIKENNVFADLYK